MFSVMESRTKHRDQAPGAHLAINLKIHGQVPAMQHNCVDEIVSTTPEPHSINGAAQHKWSHGSFA